MTEQAPLIDFVTRDYDEIESGFTLSCTEIANLRKWAAGRLHFAWLGYSSARAAKACIERQKRASQ